MNKRMLCGLCLVLAWLGCDFTVFVGGSCGVRDVASQLPTKARVLLGTRPAIVLIVMPSLRCAGRISHLRDFVV